MKNNKTLISARSRLYTSVLLVLLALVAVTAATVAWFSIADNTKVKSMSLDPVPIFAWISTRMKRWKSM